MDVHHVGIATRDSEALMDRYRAIFEWPLAHHERFDGLDIRFIDVGGRYLELLEPLEDGPVATFLAKHGPGIHHLAISTPTIDEQLERAREHGVELIDETPRPGAWDHRVAFLHPNDLGGVLLELVEV